MVKGEISTSISI